MIVERFRFNTHIRQPEESVATFIAELGHLTRYCEFGDSLKDMLQDRLVCGIDNGPMQRRLLAEPALSLDKALAMESAEWNARDLQKSQHPQAVNVLKNHSAAPQRTRIVEYYHCGRAHLDTECRFKDTECCLCKKKGQLARVCRSKKAADKSSSKSLKAGTTSKANKNTSQSTHSVETADTTGNEPEASAYTLFNVISSPSSPFIVTSQVNGADVQMEVDTGDP